MMLLNKELITYVKLKERILDDWIDMFDLYGKSSLLHLGAFLRSEDMSRDKLNEIKTWFSSRRKLVPKEVKMERLKAHEQDTLLKGLKSLVTLVSE